MTVFGIGTLEVILILLVLVLIFGPERINEMGRWLGQAYRKFTGVTNEVNQQVMQARKMINSSLEMPNVTNPLNQVTQQVEEATKGITQNLQVGLDGTQDKKQPEKGSQDQ